MRNPSATIKAEGLSYLQKIYHLHSTHPLRGTAAIVAALASALLEFHLAETEGQTDRDAAAVVLAIGGGLHVRAEVRLAPTVGVEDVVGIDKDRKLAVEEIGFQASINGETSVPLAEEHLRRGAVTRRTRHLYLIPQLRP